jgi:hypothetical protein
VVAGRIQIQGRVADMDQVDLDSQGHPDNFAGAAGDNTPLALEVGLKRQFRQN